MMAFTGDAVVVFEQTQESSRAYIIYLLKTWAGIYYMCTVNDAFERVIGLGHVCN